LPTDSARELFRPSTDSASLLVRIEKKNRFEFGVLCGDRHKWGVFFRLFGQLYTTLDAELMSQFLAQGFFGN